MTVKITGRFSYRQINSALLGKVYIITDRFAGEDIATCTKENWARSITNNLNAISRMKEVVKDLKTKEAERGG